MTNFDDLRYEPDEPDPSFACTVCCRLLDHCECSGTAPIIKTLEYVTVTMVIVNGEETTERSAEVSTGILIGGTRFATITDLIVEEFEVFDYDEGTHRLIVYQLTPVDTRPAEMRVLADKLNPRQRDR